jgi:hypothetical protein
MWAQMGSNHRPPDYEFQMEVSRRLHRFVCVCTSLIYFTLKIKYYTGLHVFVEILAKKLAYKTGRAHMQVFSLT